MTPSPSDLERRAVELYTCDCGAALDYPGAYCPSCERDPQDGLVPLEDGPDAADLWEARLASLPTLPAPTFAPLDRSALPRIPVTVHPDAMLPSVPVRLVPFGDVMVSPGLALEDQVALAGALGVDLDALDRAELEAALDRDAASRTWPLELLAWALPRLLAALAGGSLVLLFLVALLVPDAHLVPYVVAFKAAAWAALPAVAPWALGGLALGLVLFAAFRRLVVR